MRDTVPRRLCSRVSPVRRTWLLGSLGTGFPAVTTLLVGANQPGRTLEVLWGVLLSLTLAAATFAAGLGMFRLGRWALKRGHALGPRSRPHVFVCAFAYVVLFLAWMQVLVWPLHETVARWLVLGAERWVLSDYLVQPTTVGDRLRNVARKSLAIKLQLGLLDHLHDLNRTGAAADDAALVLRELSPLRARVLTAADVPHQPSDWPVVISGVGWCDQVNGLASVLLAQEFPVSQGYCVANGTGGHTIGRVWSSSTRDWVYFDVWPERVVVFRVGPDGGPIDLTPDGTLAAARRDCPTIYPLYSEVPRGWVFSEARSTFGGHVAGKLFSVLRGRSAPSFVPVRKGEGNNSVLNTNAPSDRPPSVDTRCELRRTYLRARLEHLLGGPRAAAEMYAEVVSSAQGASPPWVRAASVFHHRLLGEEQPRGEEDPRRSPASR